MKPNTLRPLIGLLCLAFFAAACGGSGSSAPQIDPPPVADTGDDADGTVIIGLTDAEGDFKIYDVGVTSITLTRPNGTDVETLPLATRMDFAQYTELTEFVTAATVPNGAYTGATVVLDYTDATIMVEDANGDALAAAVVDDAGQPVDSVALSVEFADRDGFVVAPGIPAHVTLDFDLEASHKVAVDVDSATATLDGVLIADPFLEDAKTHRACGLLADVNVDESFFVLRIRPFYANFGDFGRLRVDVLDETLYEVDGEPYEGQEGLRAMAALPTGTPVVAQGALDIRERRFVAERVLAGSSLPNGDSDVATGTVLARSGDVLTLQGTTIIRDDMSVLFNDSVAVTVGPNTQVRQQPSMWPDLSPADISVGQRLTVTGELSGEIPGNLELDATEGAARLVFSDLGGTVNALAPMSLELTQINGKRPGAFDFAGTGVSPNDDAIAEDYDVDTGTLPLDGIDLGDPVRVRGFVAPFGTAPADFWAQSIADVSAMRATAFINWQDPGSMDAFLRIDEAGVVVDLTDDELGEVHYVLQAGVAQDMLDNGTTFEITPREDGRGVFGLRQQGTLQVFTDFGSFAAALSERLANGTAVVKLRGHGRYDADTNALTAGRLVIRLN